MAQFRIRDPEEDLELVCEGDDGGETKVVVPVAVAVLVGTSMIA